ncbi:uncharacterized protein [Mytilus edulis]|uniref:uncharacterized protein n=1 Tax=Mytilus edulis TaxID=6550 RepID=UPI0039F10F6B
MFILTAMYLLDQFLPCNSQTVQTNLFPAARTNPGCHLEAVTDPSYYIIHINGYAILRQCKAGYTYSPSYCDCIKPKLTRIPRVAVFVITERILEQNDKVISCRPYFQFLFDRTTLSEDGSVPSLPTSTLKFNPVTGSTGKTAVTFYGDGIITIWGMSYITFAHKFKFMVRFKTMEDFTYEDKNYNLFGDGPCSNRAPYYGVTINPVQKSIAGNFILNNNSPLNLQIDNVDFSDWIVLFIVGMEGEIRMFTETDRDHGYMGISTIKSSSCAMEIGKDSKYAPGFVGYVDSIEFFNCFEK